MRLYCLARLPLNPAKKSPWVENTFRIKAALNLAHQGEAIRGCTPALQIRFCRLLERHQRSTRGFQLTSQLPQPLTSRGKIRQMAEKILKRFMTDSYERS